MKLTEQVESLLKHSHKARNSDTELVLMYFQRAGMNLDERQIALFKKMPSPDTITRCRRKIQEQGRYEADPETDKIRFQKYMEAKQDPETLLNNQGYRVAPWGE